MGASGRGFFREIGGLSRILKCCFFSCVFLCVTFALAVVDVCLGLNCGLGPFGRGCCSAVACDIVSAAVNI
jgi:hypothetical protein